MKKILLIILILLNIYIVVDQFMTKRKIEGIERSQTVLNEKATGWDMATEVIEDCMEYNTFGECKKMYPQYNQ